MKKTERTHKEPYGKGERPLEKAHRGDQYQGRRGSPQKLTRRPKRGDCQDLREASDHRYSEPQEPFQAWVQKNGAEIIAWRPSPSKTNSQAIRGRHGKKKLRGSKQAKIIAVPHWGQT